MNPNQQTPLLPLIGMAIVFLLSSHKANVAHAAGPIARPGCQDTCGNVRIPFPWGIGARHCFLEPWFEIYCNTSNASPKPLSKFQVEVVRIVVVQNYTDPGYERNPQIIVRIPPLNVCTSDTQHQQLSSIDLRGSPYYFSMEENVFVMEGCAGSAVLSYPDYNISLAGCATICHNHNTAMKNDNCYGVKCCQSPLLDSPQEEAHLKDFLFPQLYQIDFNRKSSGATQNCLTAALRESSSLYNYFGNVSTPDPSGTVPVSLGWTWPSNWKPDYNPHTTCDLITDANNTTSIDSCSCNEDSIGDNPYISGGCQVAEECKACHGDCYNHGNSCYRLPRFTLAAILGLSIGLGVVSLAVGCYGLYRFIKRRREMKRRAKFFKRNGGLLLEQQLSSKEGVIERTKIFTSNELEKATDHFNKNRILGEGGQGTVYKGMLSDGQIVAIKKSKLLDESQLEQFINEVVILSQINHRNVVKLLGCCLQTEVPLLVYEFIPNGTLSEHIHSPDQDFVMSWGIRLKVATDSAGAISYLHSSSSIPIYHRDIKSSNILLDDKNMAKVSDFGSSKTIAIDQTHLTTLVQGTMGYLDPEYFQSYQFTEKSDVYSFGVVLLELLTGKKPIYRAENMEQRNLVTEFLFLMGNSRLNDVLDPEIAKEAKDEELMAVANLAKRCLSWKGRMRPTMKEVAMTLEMIIKSPAEMSNQDQQNFPDEELSEIFMHEISEAEFMTSPVPASSGSSLYIDVQPQLHQTI